MIEIIGDTISIPITYADEEHLMIDTDKIREEFENFMIELEEEDWE